MTFGLTLIPSTTTPIEPEYRTILREVVRRLEVESNRQPIVRLPDGVGFSFSLPWMNDTPMPALRFRRFDPQHADFVFALATATRSFVLADREQGTLRLRATDEPIGSCPEPFIDVPDRDAFRARVQEAFARWVDFRDQVTLEGYLEEDQDPEAEDGYWREVFPRIR